ncbi:MAG: hypothetical protein DI539_12470 [Flavobacterium psychrophilum]|nr:MAG: hypothetical protein DI539_12470 [Flavobacterium psychrophilum]
MSKDLIDRIIYLNSKGETQHFQRFYEWLKNTEIIPANEFMVDDQKYYWKIVSTLEFKDLIDEDDNDWFLIYSEDETFKTIGKVRIISETNFIGIRDKYGISSLWILKSNIESIKINEIPMMIRSPYFFSSSLSHINYDFQKLIKRLKNPKIKLTEYITFPKSKDWSKRIR